MAERFSVQVRKFVDKANGDIERTTRAVTLELFKAVILATPVDTGRARGNWQTSVGQPITSVVDRLDKNGTVAIGEVSARMGKAGSITWLANNLPYIAVLEYGGYPDPVKLGTYVPGEGYEIRSSGGFSKQAPAGMVRVNIARIEELLRRAAVVQTRGR